MQDWERRWRDKATEPYTVLHIERKWPDSKWWPDLQWWAVYYRAYSKRSYAMVQGHDELAAYMQALERLVANKRKTDQLHKKNQEGANQ
jgi:hypothetical protein